MCPYQAFFVCLFFPAGNVGSLKNQISHKIQKTKYLGKKKKNIRKRLGRGTLNTCAKRQGLMAQKRRGQRTWRNLGLYAWSSLYFVKQHCADAPSIRENSQCSQCYCTAQYSILEYCRVSELQAVPTAEKARSMNSTGSRNTWSTGSIQSVEPQCTSFQ